jgi:hypothetical protein
MYRICQTIFSTNRIEYLSRALKSTQLLDFRHCEVTRVFFDDWPINRNNNLIRSLAQTYGFNNVILHEENQGITKTWQEFFEFVRKGNYDYIWHQEDDAEIMYPIRVIDLIEILQDHKEFNQIQLRRDNWYPFETDPIGPKEDDVIHGKYRVERNNPYFWMMSCLYPAWIAYEPVAETMNANPSECTLANYLLNKNNTRTGLLKTSTGGIMVNHIGEYTRGTKALKGEPGWEGFQYFDTTKNYNSKTGHEWP